MAMGNGEAQNALLKELVEFNKTPEAARIIARSIAGEMSPEEAGRLVAELYKKHKAEQSP